MHRRRTTLLVTVVVALLSLHAGAAGRNFLWKATSPQGTLYLAGSIHMLTPAYYPLDAAFGDALEQSDLLVEELDEEEMLTPAAQMKMLSRGTLPAGRQLDSVLSADTLREAKRAVEALGLPFEPLQRFKPWMLALTLEGLAVQKAGFAPELGVDHHFYSIAKASRKRVIGLETVDFQISLFDDAPLAVQDKILLETIREGETLTANVTALADAWKSGDVEKVEGLVLKDLQAEPEVYQRLLVARNQAWLPKILALLPRSKPAFIVVGAAHLIGPDGLVAMLKAKGFAVEQQ